MCIKNCKHTEHNPKEDQKEMGLGGMGSRVKKAAGGKGSATLCIQGVRPALSLP